MVSLLKDGLESSVTETELREWQPGASAWAFLPSDILSNIIKVSRNVDVAGMRRVCWSWYNGIASTLTELSNNPSHPYLVPLGRTADLFPQLKALNLSTQPWGIGQLLSPAYCSGLSVLTRLTALQVLKLCHWWALSLEGLKAISSLPKITDLDLSSCTQVTDAGLDALSNLVLLQSLNLTGCYNISDAGLASLLGLRAVVHLNLSWCSQVTGEGFHALKGMAKLARFDLTGCHSVNDHGLASIPNHSSLTDLNLSGCMGITVDSFTALSRFVNLTALQVMGCFQLNNSGFLMSQLTNFELRDGFGAVMASGLGLSSLQHIQSLKHLSLGGCCQFQGQDLHHICSCSNLKYLDMSGWKDISSQHWLGLSMLTALEGLDVSYLLHSEPPALQFLANPKVLNTLNLSGNHVHEGTRSWLASLAAVTYLDLSECGCLKDDALSCLSGLRTLRILNLSKAFSGAHFTDAGLSHISNLTNIETLKLCFWSELSDTGLTALLGMKKLANLDLTGCLSLTDSVLPLLVEFSELTNLDVVGCFRVTCLGLAMLRRLKALEQLFVSDSIKGLVEGVLPGVRKVEYVSMALKVRAAITRMSAF